MIRFTYYTLAELKPVLKHGDYVLERIAGRVYHVIITARGALMKAVGLGVALQAPILMRWTDESARFALVHIESRIVEKEVKAQ